MSTVLMPNMFMIIGPHAWAGNNPRAIEYQVNWVTEVIKYMNDLWPYSCRSQPREAQEGWHQYVVDQGKDLTEEPGRFVADRRQHQSGG